MIVIGTIIWIFNIVMWMGIISAIFWIIYSIVKYFISLADSFNVPVQKVTVKECTMCDGSGKRRETKNYVCSFCKNGYATVKAFNSDTMEYEFLYERDYKGYKIECSHCSGDGYTTSWVETNDTCNWCKGTGKKEHIEYA